MRVQQLRDNVVSENGVREFSVIDPTDDLSGAVVMLIEGARTGEKKFVSARATAIIPNRIEPNSVSTSKAFVSPALTGSNLSSTSSR